MKRKGPDTNTHLRFLTTAQQVKDLALLQLQLRFNPWPGNFHMPQVQEGKEKKTLKIYIQEFPGGLVN